MGKGQDATPKVDSFLEGGSLSPEAEHRAGAVDSDMVQACFVPQERATQARQDLRFGHLMAIAMGSGGQVQHVTWPLCRPGSACRLSALGACSRYPHRVAS